MYDIIEKHSTPGDHATRAGHVILVDRKTDYQPYVTAWQGDGDRDWCWGHYFSDLKDAQADYQSRCKRGY